MLASGTVVLPVSPIQAAKSRPERNIFASGTLAKIVLAMIGPTPATCTSRIAGYPLVGGVLHHGLSPPPIAPASSACSERILGGAAPGRYCPSAPACCGHPGDPGPTRNQALARRGEPRPLCRRLHPEYTAAAFDPTVSSNAGRRHNATATSLLAMTVTATGFSCDSRDRSTAAGPVPGGRPRRAPVRTRGRPAPAQDRGYARRSRWTCGTATGRTRGTAPA